jgi:hypothetical protein
MKFDERNHFFFKVCPTDSDFVGLSRSTRCGCCSYQVSSISVRSFFISMATAAKFVLSILISFLAYLVPLDVDVTENITAKICEVWSEFNIFCTLVTMTTAANLNFFQPPKAVDIPPKFHEV